MPTEALLSAVAEAVFDYLLQETDLADRVRAVRFVDPERKAFQTALARAYAVFARQYPNLAISLFMESFLKTEAVPILAQLLTRRGHPDPTELARLWARQLGYHDPDTAPRLAEMTGAAADFLRWLERELTKQRALWPLWDVRALEAIQADVAAIRRALEEPPPPDLADLLHPYLDWLIRQHSTLELRGIRRAGPSPVTPLEQVYAALQAETAPEAEWQESRRLLEEEFREWLETQGLADLPHLERHRLRWRFLAGHPLMPALAERDRPRLFPDRQGETLHLAEAVRRYRWLVILGDPGSGKTTLLRWLTLRLARALREGAARVLVPAAHVDAAAEEDAPDVDLGPARLPVLVRVADYAEARRQAVTEGRTPPTLFEFLGHQGWQGQFPTFGPDHPRRGERIPPEGLHRLIADFLRRGQAMVLLDGLDEITADDDRKDIVGAVEAFIQDRIPDPAGYSPLDRPDRPWRGRLAPWPAEQGGNQILITSRIAGYHDAPLSGRLTHATIQPMSDPAVDRFCRTWSGAVHRLLADPGDSEEEIAARAAAEADALIQAVHDPNRPGLRELAGNPLLLTILAMVHHNSQARLPEQRVRLYQVAVENLVEVWRDTGLSEDEVVQVLAPVAAHIHQTSPTGLIEEEELRRLITRALAEYQGEDPDRPTPAFRRNVTAFLQAVRERVGLLAARGEAVYGFLHLTFQEYLAARHLAGDPEAALEAILARRHDPRWREPILLALGYLSWTQNMPACLRLLRALLEADDPLDDLLPRGTLLVTAALPEMVKAPPTIVEEVVRRLLRAYAALPYTWLREEVSRTLERLRRGDEAPLVERVLAEALTTPPPAGAPDPGLAAAALIREHGWFTRDLAEALLTALPRDRGEEGWPVTLALAVLGAAQEAAQAQLSPSERNHLAARAAFLAAQVKGKEAAIARALAALAPHLAEPERTQTLEAALRAAATIAFPWERVPSLAALALHMAEPERTRILQQALQDAAAAHNADDGGGEVMAELIPYLADRPDLLAEAQQAVAAMVNDHCGSRVLALAALAPHLAEPKRTRTLREALQAADAIHYAINSSEAADALAALAPHLAGHPDLLADALRAATYITQDRSRADALAALAPHLAGHPDLLADALRAATSIADDLYRACALAALAPHLAGHPDLLADALRAATSIADDLYRTCALAALAHHLAEPERTQALQDALRAAAAIADDWRCADVLAALAPHLAGHPHLLADALRAAAAIADEDDRARALADLVPHLAGHPHLLADALRQLRALVAPLSALAALLPLTDLRFVWPETPSAGWAALACAADVPTDELAPFVAWMAEAAAEKGLSYTAEAATALQALREAGRVEAVAALLPLLQEPAPEALRQAETWLSDPEPALARHAALLLAEAGRLSPATLPHLLDLLRTGPDRSRCRAMLALYARGGLDTPPPYRVSALGRERVEALAALYREHHAEPQVGTVLGWALEALFHDDPALLAAWAGDLAAGRAEAEIILGRVHHLTPDVWAEMARHLRSGPPAVQAALLASLYWLLRLGTLPVETLPKVRKRLRGLVACENETVRRAAVAALGRLPAPQPEDWGALLPLRAESAADAGVHALALARLGACLKPEARAPMEAALQAALSDPLWARPAAGGLVRLYLADAGGKPEEFDPAPLLEQLLGAPPEGLGLTPKDALVALLAAGEDDDVWDDYHGRVVRTARALIVARPDDLFAPLLAHLEEALAADDWPPRRIALAVAAAVAEALPAHFQRRADPRRLERLLVLAARDAESVDTRRFALTALSHLRRVTPAVAEALLAALRDVGDVQQDALAAAERFRLAEGDIVPALAAALQDESAATAYAAAQVLAALGRSAQTADRRPAVVEALAAALRSPGARRGVYVLVSGWRGHEVKYLGRLDEALYRALVQVTGAGA